MLPPYQDIGISNSTSSPVCNWRMNRSLSLFAHEGKAPGGPSRSHPRRLAGDRDMCSYRYLLCGQRRPRTILCNWVLPYRMRSSYWSVLEIGGRYVFRFARRTQRYSPGSPTLDLTSQDWGNLSDLECRTDWVVYKTPANCGCVFGRWFRSRVFSIERVCGWDMLCPRVQYSEVWWHRWLLSAFWHVLCRPLCLLCILLHGPLQAMTYFNGLWWAELHHRLALCTCWWQPQ